MAKIRQESVQMKLQWISYSNQLHKPRDSSRAGFNEERAEIWGHLVLSIYTFVTIPSLSD